MARPKKIKVVPPPTSEDDTLPFIEEEKSIENDTESETLPESNIGETIQSETVFLEELLESHVSGCWGGPTAQLIRERLKLLKG